MKSEAIGGGARSAFTSVNKNKVPKLFSAAAQAGLVKPGMQVFDYGCGRWPENVREYLATLGIDVVVSYDPCWFPIPLGFYSGQYDGQGYDLVCLSNVLNVISERADREAALRSAWGAVKPGGRMLVTVYEADGSGASGPSRKGCWQERRKLRSYMDDELAPYHGEIVPGTGGKLWASMPKPAAGGKPKPTASGKWYPSIGAKLTLHYFTGSETPYTVVGMKAGKLVIRRCELVFKDGIRYYDTLPDEIREGGPYEREEELVWRPKRGEWRGKGRYGGWVSWGRWNYQPALL